MLYGAVAAFGLSIISSLLISERLWIHLIGAGFLCWLGAKTLLTRPSATPTAELGRTNLVGFYVTTLLLTLTNPTTILSFIAIFAGIGVVGPAGGPAALTVLGIFSGSALWWLTLSGIVNMIRVKFTPRMMRLVNSLSGAILLAFAAYALLTLAT
jgi:threonine/homoserine/homoserine lactone efflux protein